MWVLVTSLRKMNNQEKKEKCRRSIVTAMQE